MSTTTSFALTLKPIWFCVIDAATRRSVDWRFTRGKFWVTLDHRVDREFATEFEAWSYIQAERPDTFDKLRSSEMVSDRGYALRAEMMLTLGPVRFKEMTDDLHKTVMRIFQFAMEALDATKVSKAIPGVTRVAPSRAVSWLDVRTNVELPYQNGTTLLSVRCAPSPVDDNTWSVRLRVPAKTDSAILEVQHRFEELVRTLGYQGIIVKDVQNGTCLDL
jgi:hypothetical protein